MLDLFPVENLEHLYFGTINGPGGQPFKTRDGNAAGLLDIIDMVGDAVRARVADAGKTLDNDTIESIALAALKFTDLMHDVKSDYIFDPAQITSFEGRTGPYILYTAVRLNSVLRRAGVTTPVAAPELSADERNLLIGILDFERVVQNTFENRSTDLLANYTYDLCQLVNTFYHNCPILRDDVAPQTRAARLHIAAAAQRTLADAIGLMGLKIPAEM